MQRSLTLISVVKALAETKETEMARLVVGETLASAAQINGGLWERKYAFSQLATTLAQQGMFEEARQPALEMLASARQDTELGTPYDSLAEVTELMVKVRLEDEARRVAIEMAAQADKEPPAKLKCDDLAGTAVALAVVGMKEEAKRFAERAVRVGDEDTRIQNDCFAVVVKALALAGDTGGTVATLNKMQHTFIMEDVQAEPVAAIVQELIERKRFDEALRVARDAKYEVTKFNSLTSITKALAADGRTTAAQEAALEAFAAARNIGYLDKAIESLAVISVELSALGLQEARQAAVEILLLLQKVDSLDIRSHLLASTAKHRVRAGMGEDVVRDARLLVQLAQQPTGLDRRAIILTGAARALAIVGQADEALEVGQLINASSPELTYFNEVFEVATRAGKADQAIALAHTMPHDQPRSRAFSTIASVLASAGEYRRALAVAENCPFSDDKLAAYTSVLLAYAIERRPALASLIRKGSDAEDLS
jgi:tetratricopeptide (TPR) repeat protein